MEDNNEKKLSIFQFEGARYKTYLTKKFAERTKWKPDNPNIILAVIPGTVVKLTVKIGQKVNAGRCLYVLEAMKMKNKILATKSGIVKSIHVQEGQRVPKNELMMELQDIEVKKKSRATSKAKKSK
jgi:biotin carboxyl carrier protein